MNQDYSDITNQTSGSDMITVTSSGLDINEVHNFIKLWLISALIVTIAAPLIQKFYFKHEIIFVDLIWYFLGLLAFVAFGFMICGIIIATGEIGIATGLLSVKG